jgi:type II secretory pathway component PulF
MDYLKYREVAATGDTGLSSAYFASAALGGGLALAFFFSHFLGPIGWLIVGIAVIALLLVTLWIEKNKDNTVQEWLMRCHFGSSSDKYQTEQEHVAELKLAFA